MGQNRLASFKVEDAKHVQAGKIRISMEQQQTDFDGDELSVCWGRKVVLNGDYFMTLSLTKNDVAEIFKRTFGETVTMEILDECGITLEGREVVKDWGEITLRDLLERVQGMEDT